MAAAKVNTKIELQFADKAINEEQLVSLAKEAYGNGSLTPQIAETQYWVIFLHKFQNLVYRNAVLCYNRTRCWGGSYGETKQG